MKAGPGAGSQISQDAALATHLNRVLMASDGTTTSLLESFLDEPLRVEVVPQRPANAVELAEWPGTPPQSGILVRDAKLIGRRTGRLVVHARSLVVLDRLPERSRTEIREGRELLGRTLRTHRVEQHREILTTGHGRAPATTNAGDATAMPWRTYAIVVGGVPAVLVTEWFQLHHPEQADGESTRTLGTP